jgi:hypothetical protein
MCDLAGCEERRGWHHTFHGFGYCQHRTMHIPEDPVGHVSFESVGRGGVIRTRDPLRPRQVRYQAALRPDVVYFSVSKSKLQIQACCLARPGIENYQPTTSANRRGRVNRRHRDDCLRRHPVAWGELR